MKTFKLNRTKQCAKCPWKVSTNPHDIPDGYSVEQHKALEKTIWKEGDNILPRVLRHMACHHSHPVEEMHCVGWVYNQLYGEQAGDNIALRINMTGCLNLEKLEIVGEQHPTFKDTLPKPLGT